MSNIFEFQAGDLLHFPKNKDFGAAMVIDTMRCEAGLPYYMLHFQKDGNFVELSAVFVESRGTLL